MKSLLLSVIISLLGAFTLSSQSSAYVDWEWDILKLGFATSTSQGVGSGVEFGSELRYNVKDELSLGLAWEGAAFGDNLGSDNVELGLAANLLLTGDRYLKTDSGTRAFFGLGIGTYSNGSVTINNGTAEETIPGESSFGVAPRIGYELGHGRLLAQYNYTLKKETTNYLTVTLALTLWGGYVGG